MKGSIIYLAEELEIADKKRKLNPSKTAIDESTPDPNNTDQDMADTNPQDIGESSSSTDAAPPSTETAGDQRTNFFQMHGERCEQPHEIPVPEASSSSFSQCQRNYDRGHAGQTRAEETTGGRC